MIQKEHTSPSLCNCGKSLNSIYSSIKGKIQQIKGFGYCNKCSKIFRIKIKEVCKNEY